MGYTSQSSGIIDHAFLKTIWNGLSGNGVISGLAATSAGTDLDVDLSAGVVVSNGKVTTYAGGSVTLSAGDSTNPRMDAIIWDDSANAPAVLEGTPTAESASQTRPPLSDTADAADFLIAVVYMAAGATVVASSGVIFDRRPIIREVCNYKSSTQVFTTDTTYADVTGNSSDLEFPVGVSEVWVAEWHISVVGGGTGGVKFQLTGPSTPTHVRAQAQVGMWSSDSAAALDELVIHDAPATAFSGAILARNHGTANGELATGEQFITIRAYVGNGANAGTVTLQAAQNSSNSTTTLGIGSWMRARRIK